MQPHSSGWQIQLICQSVRCTLVRLNGLKQWLLVFTRALCHQVIIQLNSERFYPSPNLSSADEYASKNLAVHSYSQCITQTAEDVWEVMMADCKKTTKSLDSVSFTHCSTQPPLFFHCRHTLANHWLNMSLPLLYASFAHSRGTASAPSRALQTMQFESDRECYQQPNVTPQLGQTHSHSWDGERVP